MKTRVVVLGAGFGGLELSTMLSDALGDDLEISLIDKRDSFVFGYSKLDVLFGRTTLDAARVPYAAIAKPGLRFIRETVTAIDPEAMRVTTEVGQYEADYLVIALGADYDYDATPGLLQGVDEFYSPEGAQRMGGRLPSFTHGRAVIGVCGAPFKCPPAPGECALLLHDYLVERGLRTDCDISVVMPFDTPVPPSPETSQALLEAFAECDITFLPERRISSLDPRRGVVLIEGGEEIPYDLFLGVPKHRAPDVVISSGITEDGYVPVDSGTLETKIPRVYALGDVATIGVPKAGVFAERAARVVAKSIVARIKGEGGGTADRFDGTGSCYIEFGGGRVGRIDVDFFSGPKPTGTYHEASIALAADKAEFGSSRRARWFGL